METEELVKLESRELLELIKKELEKLHTEADHKLKELFDDCDCMRKY